MSDSQKAALEIYEWLAQTGRLKPNDDLVKIALTAIIARFIDKHLC